MGGYFQGALPSVIADGAMALPGLSYLSDTSTGFYFSSQGNLTASVGGIKSLSIPGNNSLNNNTTFGYSSISPSAVGYFNSAFGFKALENLTTGYENSAFGFGASRYITTGIQNTSFGWSSAGSLMTGSYNTFYGSTSGSSINTGSNNVIIGNHHGFLDESLSLIIDGSNTNTPTPLIYGKFDFLGGLLGTLQINGVFSALGTTTNNDASAGQIGEYIESKVAIAAAVALTTGAAANITSIALTPGDWDVSGFIGFAPTATTSLTHTSGCSSAATVTMDVDGQTALTTPAIVPGTANEWVQTIPVRRISIAVNTTVYLVSHAVFTVSTLGGYGTIRARRMR